jgi:hypothetical protein
MKNITLLFACLLPLASQSPTPKSFVGTVTGFRPERAEIEIKPDTGDAVLARVTPDTVAQQVAAGERDLNKAAPLKATDLARGDRVLVTLAPGSTDIRRIVVMTATDIAKRNDADRAEWQRRGIAGVVSAKSGKQITVKTTATNGVGEAVVALTERTTFKHYAPDSVKFSDARPSSIAEVNVGDQMRARGEKSEDGMKVTAEEVVFGTFLVKAGSLVAVDKESREIEIKELGTNKPLKVKLTADSQLKQMPGMPMMMGAPARGGIPAGTPPSGGPPGPGGPPPMGRGGMPGGFDVNQMLDRMPAATLDSIALGSTVVVSSTKGAKGDQLTAILVIANADMLIQMASMANGGRGRDGAPGMGSQGMGPMMGGDLGGLAGLGLGGIIP